MPDGGTALSTFRRDVAAALPATTDALAVWRALGAGGLLDALSNAPPGGRTDIDRRRLDDLLAELDARLPVGAVLSVCVQIATVVPLLRDLAPTSPYAAGVLEAALAGEAVVALAVTDSAAPGSDLLEAETALSRVNGDSRLDGRKSWITNAGHCTHALVLARHRPARHFTSFQWVLVPATAEGVSAQAAATDLFAGSGVGHLRFDAVRLAPEQVVGAPGRALAQFVHHIYTERLAGALWARSLCRRVLIDTRTFLADRQLHGMPQWDNAAIRERFARCLIDLNCLDAVCATEHGHAAGDDDDRAKAASITGARRGAMLLKATSALSVDRILSECVSLRGADAFRDGGEAMLRAEAAMFGTAGGAVGALLAGIADHADEVLAGSG